MSTTTLLIGATSAMAEHTARLLAADGETLILAGRSAERLQTLASDLKIRGAEEVTVLPVFDAARPDSVRDFCNHLEKLDEPLDRILIAHGHLPVQGDCEDDAELTRTELEINFHSVVTLCTTLANILESRGQGTLAVISSVAGLRGRQSNYVYGAAKGGLNIFLQGLRNRLQPEGVRVLTLLPGFVDTPMTADIEKGPLFVSAERAGACIHKALTQSKGDIVYVPFFWRYILWIIRAIPETVFKRLKL
jgi:short-subunit dehydrogenase